MLKHKEGFCLLIGWIFFFFLNHLSRNRIFIEILSYSTGSMQRSQNQQFSKEALLLT